MESTSDYWRIWYYLLEAAGLSVQLVNARDVKNVPGPAENRQAGRCVAGQADREGPAAAQFRAARRRSGELRDYTRLRVDLTRERTRYWQRLEKLLEDALIKVSAVASTLDTLSVRDMLEALIAGERDPRRLADLARGRMKTKRAALIEALTGRFDDHHAELARMLLDQIDALATQIATLTTRIDELLDRDRTPSPRRRRRRHATATGSADADRSPASCDRGRAPRRDPRHRPGTSRRSSSPRSGWT